MEDSKFYGVMSFVFGIIGFLCSVIMVGILCYCMNTNVRFGNVPYIFCSCVSFLCFIFNRFLYKKSEKNRLSTFGALFGILSIVPIVLFFIVFILVVFAGTFIINNFTPTIYN